MKDDKELLERIEEFNDSFADKDVSRPIFWSGFRVRPSRIELWEEGNFRIHKRILYQKNQEGWDVSLLYP
jgi:pyridoxamine 5'-phosphate oxidase